MTKKLKDRQVKWITDGDFYLDLDEKHEQDSYINKCLQERNGAALLDIIGTMNVMRQAAKHVSNMEMEDIPQLDEPKQTEHGLYELLKDVLDLVDDNNTSIENSASPEHDVFVKHLKDRLAKNRPSKTNKQ